MRVHLVNAGKYLSMILIQFANIFRHKLKGDVTLLVFVGVGIASTLYAYCWDLYMDWGLVRSREKDTFLLRPKHLLPRWFYYYAMASNLLLRFAWLATLVPVPQWVH